MVYGRVTVLALALMLFVGIWSSDQPAIRQDYAARHRIETFAIGRLNRQLPIHRSGVSTFTATRKRASVDVHQVATTGTTQRSIPSIAIPADLTTGFYRVVNTNGVSATVAVTPEWLTRENIPTNLPGREFYIRQSENECWYWIRLQERPDLATAGL